MEKEPRASQGGHPPQGRIALAQLATGRSLQRINNPEATVAERMSHLTRHVVEQLPQLLRVAGLPVSSKLRSSLLRMQQHETRGSRRRRLRPSSQTISRDRLNANRRSFLDTIDWNKIRYLVNVTAVEAEEAEAMRETIVKTPGLRRQLNVALLARVKVRRGRRLSCAANPNSKRPTAPARMQQRLQQPKNLW